MKSSKHEDSTGNPVKIIRSTAPIRINDIGGWTDTWFSGRGRVLNTAVSPGTEISISVSMNSSGRKDRILIHALNYDKIFRVIPEEPDYRIHPLIQGAINMIPPPPGLELKIAVQSKVPAGISTGTSASVCVSLLGALDCLKENNRSAKEIARLAFAVETEKLNLQSGIQDQICAALGGICDIRMVNYPDADIYKLDLTDDLKSELDRRLVLVYFGQSHHNSSELHKEVISFLEEEGSGFHIFEDLRSLAGLAKDALLSGNMGEFGKVMIRNNECQRALHPSLVPKEADRIIQVSRKYRAEGWKVNGAGGSGGSMVILGPNDGDDCHKMSEEIDSLGEGICTIPITVNFTGLKTRISEL
ncbi:GHMP kinase [Acidobacteriota bacterium]